MHSTEPSLDSSLAVSRQAGAGLPSARLLRVTAYIDENLPRPLTLVELSGLALMSRFHFARLFKQSTGLSPHRFVMRRRVDRACELLAERELPIKSIALSVGFRTCSHFSTMFRRITGRCPSAYRRSAIARGASTDN